MLELKLDTIKATNTLGYQQQISIAMQTLLNLYNVWKNAGKPEECPVLCTQSDLLLRFVENYCGTFGQQQVEDLRREVLRLRRVAQMEALIVAENQIIAAVEKAEKNLENMQPGTSADKKARQIAQAREKFLENSKFEANFNQFSNIVLNDNCYSFLQDSIAADLLKLMVNDLSVSKRFQNLFHKLEICPIPDVLDVSSGNFYLCSENHVTLIQDKDEAECSTCKTFHF